MYQRAAIIGAGAFGTAMANHVASLPAGRCADVVLYARDAAVAEAVNTRHENPARLPGIRLAAQLRATADLAAALDGADLVLLAVPAQHVRAMASTIAAHLAPRSTIVDLAKGIERDRLRMMTEILAETLGPMNGGHVLAALGGPSFAHDLAAGQPVGLTLGCRPRRERKRLQATLSTDNVDIKSTHDVRGVELGGALKNVFAIAAGMMTGVGVGDSLMGDYFTRALVEMRDIGLRFGGRWATFSGRSGLGDLVVSCTDASRNFRFGRYYAEAHRDAPGMDRAALREAAFARLGTRTVEGLPTLDAVATVARHRRMLTPITDALWSVVYGETHSPAELLAEFRRLDRRRGREGLPVVSIVLHELTPQLWFRRR